MVPFMTVCVLRSLSEPGNERYRDVGKDGHLEELDVTVRDDGQEAGVLSQEDAHRDPGAEGDSDL